MWDYLNIRLSTPIAISIVLILVILVSGFNWWQYKEMQIEASKISEIEIELPEKKKDIQCSNVQYGLRVVPLEDGIGAAALENGLGVVESETGIPVIIKTSNEFLELISPIPYEEITNPLIISGRSNFLEAKTRIRIVDNNNCILADTSVNAEGWMDDLYPFSGEIPYSTPSSDIGFLEVFENSAKDGEEINKVIVPIFFEKDNSKTPFVLDKDLFFHLEDHLEFKGDNFANFGNTSDFKWMHGAEDPENFKFSVLFWLKVDDPNIGDHTDYVKDPYGAVQGLVMTSSGRLRKTGISIVFNDTKYSDSAKISKERSIWLYITRGIEETPAVTTLEVNEAFPDDTGWHHIAVVYNHSLERNNAKIYVDGILKGQGNKRSYPPSLEDSETGLYIGSFGHKEHFLKGEIKDLYIYKRALTTRDIRNFQEIK